MSLRFMAGSPLLAAVIVFTVVGCKTRVETPPPVPFFFPHPPPPPAPIEKPRFVPPPRPEADAAVTITTLNGDPRGLKREALRAALDAAMPSFAACLQNSTGAASVGLTFDAQPDGSAQNIQVTGVSPSNERCISSALTRLRLPLFEGKPVPVEFPLTLYRPTATATTESAPDAASIAPAAPVRPSSVGVMPSAPMPAPPPGPSTAPYVPPVLPATPGSAPASTEGKNFIQP